MSTFERYLTLWVALCIVAGVALGHLVPPLFQAIGAAEIAKVNLPVADVDLDHDHPDAGQGRFRGTWHEVRQHVGEASA